MQREVIPEKDVIKRPELVILSSTKYWQVRNNNLEERRHKRPKTVIFSAAYITGRNKRGKIRVLRNKKEIHIDEKSYFLFRRKKGKKIITFPPEKEEGR